MDVLSKFTAAVMFLGHGDDGDSDGLQSDDKKFPFYGRNSERQVAVLSSYLIEATAMQTMTPVLTP